MTWILGWPITMDHILEYVVKQGLYKQEDLIEDERVHAFCVGIRYMRQRCKVGLLPVRPCWVDSEIQGVFALIEDEDATSPDDAYAEEEMLPISIRRCCKLAIAAGHNGPPAWYRMYDLTWHPDFGDLRPQPEKKLKRSKGGQAREDVELDEDSKKDTDSGSEGGDDSDSSYDSDFF